MAPRTNDYHRLTRRALLKTLGTAPLLLRASPFHGASLLFPPSGLLQPPDPAFPFTDVRLTPHYPTRSPLEDVLRLVAPGSDEYVTEKYAYEIGEVLKQWSQALKSGQLAGLAASFAHSLQASPLVAAREVKVRTGGGMESTRRVFSQPVPFGPERFVDEIREWLGRDARVETAEFEITSLAETASEPLAVQLLIRYSIVIAHPAAESREERIGTWQTDWLRETAPGPWKVQRWQGESETVGVVRGPVFVDVSHQALGGEASYSAQMLRGADHWRTVLDGACGIDVYGNNGVAAGDFDNDGFDDLYISQPAGLPNRLYRNRGDGTFEDVTDRAGVGVLDNTACALFADFRNVGLQDLLVVCGSGPLLFVNQGNGTFVIKRDAFQFARPPLGSFTHAAIADYDRDGRLDIYFCLYSYYLGLDQYHYPVPYFDARNGPPNFLLHNEGNGTFVDRTEAAGLNADNDRYSFACAWGESASGGAPNPTGAPDLYVANDFGRNSFYLNHGDGTFKAAATQAHVEDVGAGMSACWGDYNNDGRNDLYVANMWSAAGQRVAQQKLFHEKAPAGIRELYQRHARGNALYRNQGAGVFENVSQQAGVETGRWAWGSDFWDFDHDGYPDLYVTNGYISAPAEHAWGDLGSFFWRQVVAKSPDDSTPSLAYEHGWNALNELIRSDNSWSGFERNVMFANNRDGTFSEVSGAVGLDFVEDGRSFALADLDQDGRLEIILKNRNAPQLRVLHNTMKDLGASIAFRLRGTKSNRDAIGAAITLEGGDLRQTKYLQAGSGFLAQHSKEVFFGVGKPVGTIRATVRWPSGLTQRFEALPVNNRILLEEGTATFVAKPFAPSPASWSQATQAQLLAPADSPSASVETWLIDPLKAPDFSLPDLTGALQRLASLRGSFVLLYFWSLASPLSSDQLKLLSQHQATPAASQFSILAVNVDRAEDAAKARSFAQQQRLSFPVLLATEEVAGIYNITYRYLFDRRRDLPLPAAFLLDKEGMIVKVYQGALKPESLLADMQSAAANPEQRMRRALPFAGTLYQGSFHRNEFTYGVAMFQHGYLDQAAESFQQVIAARPDDAEGYYNLGTLNLRRNDFAAARTYLQQTLKLKPNYPEAWNNLGMMAAQQGQPEEAIQSFQQALLLRPQYATALLNLGNVYRRQKDMANAQQYLTRALELQPDDPEANYSLGMFYAQQGQLPSASQYLEKAVALRPEYPEALNNLGIIFVREQEYTKAQEQFRTCIRVAPGFDQSYLNLARLYVLQHDKAKATEALQDLLRVQPQSASAKQGLEMVNSMP